MRKLFSILMALCGATMLFAASSTGVRHQQPPRVPVIMAQFADVPFKAASTAASFSDFFNGENYSFESATGSVQQYFRENSFGKYVPTFDVLVAEQRAIGSVSSE